jgi:methionyl aminopeptidase
MIFLKNPEQIAGMRSAGHLLYDVLCALRELIKPGITTKDIDAFAEELICNNHAVPSFLHYRGYPASVCTSIDDEVVHGIPSDATVLHEGSIISIDCGLVLNEWQSDSAFTVGIGAVSESLRLLISATEECFWKGAREAVAGKRLGDISHAVQSHAESYGYGVVRALTGHGIGREMHEDPSVPNFGEAGHGVRLQTGMTLAIEPMIAMGRWQVHELNDGWTIVTNDHSPCSHYEHTIAIRCGLPEILTLPGYSWDIKGEVAV